MRAVVGVEGGGTYTRAAALSLETLQVLSYALSGPSNYHNVGVKRAMESVRRAYLKALRRAGNPRVEHVTVGLPALNTRFDRERLERALGRVLEGVDYALEHDVHIALYAATAGGPGILVVAGTGCNVYGYSDGRKYYAGDWGWMLGDEGSAYRLGASLLNLALREYDGRAEGLGVLAPILSHLGLEDAEELLDWAYGAGVEGIASLARLACRLAGEVPEVRAVVVKAAKELSLAVRAVWLRMGRPTVPLYYTGGLFDCPVFRDAFKESVGRLTGLSPRALPRHPLTGALIISLHKIGVEADPDAIDSSLRRIMGAGCGRG